MSKRFWLRKNSHENDWSCGCSWSIGTIWSLLVAVVTVGISPNVTVWDLFCATAGVTAVDADASIIELLLLLLFGNDNLNSLSPFSVLLLPLPPLPMTMPPSPPPPPPLPLLFCTVQLSFFTFSVIANTFVFLKLFLRRKLPDPFSLLRRDDVRCGRWRKLPRLRPCFVW